MEQISELKVNQESVEIRGAVRSPAAGPSNPLAHHLPHSGNFTLTSILNSQFEEVILFKVLQIVF